MINWCQELYCNGTIEVQQWWWRFILFSEVCIISTVVFFWIICDWGWMYWNIIIEKLMKTVSQWPNSFAYLFMFQVWKVRSLDRWSAIAWASDKSDQRCMANDSEKAPGMSYSSQWRGWEAPGTVFFIRLVANFCIISNCF